MSRTSMWTSSRQKDHLDSQNRTLNIATRLSLEIVEGDTFWQLTYNRQLKGIIDRVIQLKPLLDFFIKNEAT